MRIAVFLVACVVSLLLFSGYAARGEIAVSNYLEIAHAFCPADEDEFPASGGEARVLEIWVYSSLFGEEVLLKVRHLKSNTTFFVHPNEPRYDLSLFLNPWEMQFLADEGAMRRCIVKNKLFQLFE